MTKRESAIWHDIQREKTLEEQKRKEQVPGKASDRLQWGREKKVRSTICNRRKINLNTEEWSLECECDKMRRKEIIWRGIYKW